MKMKRLIVMGLGVSVALMAGVANAATWRFGIEETEGSVQYAYAQKFKKLIEKKSDGDITVKVLPYGSWGSVYTDLYDAAQNGSIQIAFASGALGSTVPESQLLNLNYVFPPDQWKTAKLLNSDDFLKSDAWQEAFHKRDLHPISELAEGYQVWTSNEKFRTPEQMENLSIRVMNNSLLKKTYSQYGASPQSIAYGELYSAMQQGQVDANIQPVWAHENMSFYEVQKYLIFGKQAQFVATGMTNNDWYQGLSDEQREMIDDVTSQLVKFGYDTQKEYNEKRLQTMQDEGDIEVIRLNKDEQAKFAEAAKPVRKVYTDQVGELGKKALNIILDKSGR